MSFTIFQDSTTAIASEVNDNFYYIGQGTRLPYGGTSLTSTDSIYDLGSSAAKWNNLYCNNIYVNSSADGIWYLVSETDIAVETARVEVSGLTGDADTEYKIIVRCVAVQDTACSIGLYINGDSGSNYGTLSLNGILSATSALQTTNASEIELLNWANQTTGVDQMGFVEGTIYAKTGEPRTGVFRSVHGASETFVYRVAAGSAIWNNTADSITSLVFAPITAGHNGFEAGSHIEVWKR